MDRILRSFTGAQVRRVVDASNASVEEHAHDWPVLSIYVMGSYTNRTELGEAIISAPSAVFYRSSTAHQNSAGAVGFEQIEIEFDPAWIGGKTVCDEPVMRWIGGTAVREARELARCSIGADEEVLRKAVARMLEPGRLKSQSPRPAWVDWIDGRLKQDTGVKLQALGRTLDRHPSWLGTAYRQATGETFGEVAGRLRMERAAKLLRESDEGPALIALEAGFCDQSHMIRTFRRLLGRTPSDVRSDRSFMRSGANAARP